jgi:hypothetical protein
MADEHRHRAPTAGAHPHPHPNLYDATTGSIPKFKRERKREKPRLAPVMALAWAGAFIMAILGLVRGIHPITEPDRWEPHYIVDSFVALVLVITISYLWAAWEREEQFPELLPRKEFDRRYPPSSAAPPTPSEPLRRTEQTW